ncbi:MAG: transcriptional regulator [Hydrogenophilaceae bacterium]|nr:transcriptional regulator [Hydrogenophilaceae bacterium]
MANKPEIPNLDSLFGGAVYASAKTLAVALETSPTTIWRWTKAGRLPKPYRLGKGTTRWKVGEIRAALEKIKGEV